MELVDNLPPDSALSRAMAAEMSRGRSHSDPVALEAEKPRVASMSEFAQFLRGAKSNAA